MDGGMRTVANADLAHGYERVVIVAPVAAGIGFMASPRGQAAALTAAGARVVLVRPDRAAVRAIGRNVLDVSSRAAAARAGWAQAAAETQAVRATGRPDPGQPRAGPMTIPAIPGLHSRSPSRACGNHPEHLVRCGTTQHGRCRSATRIGGYLRCVIHSRPTMIRARGSQREHDRYGMAMVA